MCVCVYGSWPGDMWARPWRGCITDFPNFHKAFGTTPHKRLFQSIQGLGIPSVYTIKWQANCILSWACQCRVGKWCPLTRKMHFIVGLSLWVSDVYEVLPTLVTAFFPIAPCRIHKWISILPQNIKNKRRMQWNCWYCPNKKTLRHIWSSTWVVPLKKTNDLCWEVPPCGGPALMDEGYEPSYGVQLQLSGYHLPLWLSHQTPRL